MNEPGGAPIEKSRALLEADRAPRDARRWDRDDGTSLGQDRLAVELEGHLSLQDEIQLLLTARALVVRLDQRLACLHATKAFAPNVLSPK